MSGGVTMALGPFAFRAHGLGYTDVSRSLETPWAEIEVIGRFNELQWMGPTSETVTINGVLFPKQHGGQGSLEGIKAAQRMGIPLILVSLGGLIFGSQAIQGVQEDRSFHDRYGQPGRNAYSITLARRSAGFSLMSLFGG